VALADTKVDMKKLTKELGFGSGTLRFGHDDDLFNTLGIKTRSLCLTHKLRCKEGIGYSLWTLLSKFIECQCHIGFENDAFSFRPSISSTPMWHDTSHLCRAIQDVLESDKPWLQYQRPRVVFQISSRTRRIRIELSISWEPILLDQSNDYSVRLKLPKGIDFVCRKFCSAFQISDFDLAMKLHQLGFTLIQERASSLCGPTSSQ